MRIAYRHALILGGLLLMGGGSWFVGNPPPQAEKPVNEPRPPEVLSGPEILPTIQAISVLPVTLPTRQDDANIEARFRQLESQLLQLSQQLHTQQSRLQEQRNDVKRLTRALEQQHATQTSGPARKAEVSSQSEQDDKLSYVTQLETALRLQSFDAAESAAAREQIATAVEQAAEHLGAATGQGSALLDTSCGVTMCRIELLHDNQQALESFVEEFPRHLSGDADGYVDTVQHADGSLSTFVYLSRNGQPLPTLSN